MTENTQMMALNNNWLDAQTYNTQTTGVTLQQLTSGCTQYYPYVSGWSYPVYITSPARPIKLTLSEVERLRKVAKADENVKVILKKFTDQIEVTVDF